MLEIEFEQPCKLHMEVVETDDHVPSMRVETEIVVEQFQHTLSYHGFFWIECAKWSSFTDALHDLPSRSAVLKDMSDYFTLKVCENNGKWTLFWEFRKADIGGGGKHAMAVFSADIDDAMLRKMQEKFAEFPAWW